MLDTLVVTLLLTIPSTRASSMWIPPQDRDTPADSIAYSCEGDEPTDDVDSLRFYGIPSTGGGWRRVYAKSVRGRSGLDSTTLKLPGWLGGHFYATAVDTARNESCASSVVYFGSITGVDPPRSLRVREVRAEWYDVRGRRLSRLPSRTGLFFFRWVVDGRPQPAQKVPIVEGRPIVKIRGP